MVGGRGGGCTARATHLLYTVTPFEAAFILGRQKRTIPKAASRDVGTGRVHRDSEALCRCKGGTGPRPGITSASPGIVFVIAALD